MIAPFPTPSPAGPAGPLRPAGPAGPAAPSAPSEAELAVAYMGYFERLQLRVLRAGPIVDDVLHSNWNGSTPAGSCSIAIPALFVSNRFCGSGVNLKSAQNF